MKFTMFWKGNSSQKKKRKKSWENEITSSGNEEILSAFIIGNEIANERYEYPNEKKINNEIPYGNQNWK